MSNIFKFLERIIDGEDRLQTKQAILAMPITPGEVFRRIKKVLMNFFLNSKVLRSNKLELVKLPKMDRKPNDSNYYYFFDKAQTTSIPTRNELRNFIFAVANLLGKEDLDESDFNIQEAWRIIDMFSANGWATIIESSDGILKEAKLRNIKLLIRVADHDRKKLLLELDDAECYGSESDIIEAQGILDRYDARKSIVDEDKYFDVDDTLENIPKNVKSIGKARCYKIIRELRDNLNLLNNSESEFIYDVEQIHIMIRDIYEKYTRKR